MWSGALILAFVAFQLWGTSVEEKSEQRELGSSLVASVENHDVDGDATDASTVSDALARLEPSTVDVIPPPQVGEGAGVIEIPKIEVTRFFVEGVSKKELKKGPGHYPGGPLPGQPGNVGIAGHRTTYGAPFHRIDELVPGDRINTFTAQGKFVYEVIAPPEGVGIERGPGWFTVRPEQSDVLNDQGDNRLTLTSCHPKYSARQRIIVSAKLVDEPAPAPPPPAEPVAEPVDTNQLDEGFAGEDDALAPAIQWGIGAHLIVAAAWLLGRAWRKWPAIAIGAVPFMFGIWNCFYHLNRYLPSL